MRNHSLRVLQYGFAVVRETNLVDETHLELARKFGELDDVTPYNKAGRVHRLKYNELFDVGNIELDGSIVDINSPRGEANKVCSYSPIQYHAEIEKDE